MKYLLPIGSMVWVDNQPKMVIGYFSMQGKNFYDYIATNYPIGVSNADISYFNDADIKKIVFIGYQNEQTDLFNDQMLAMRELYKSGKSIEEIQKETKGVTVSFENI